LNNVGVLAHETYHVVGAPDLYHYSQDGIQPVGAWDLMEADQTPPQHMGCFMKWKYGGWISSIPEITTAGTYTLPPMGPSGDCYKIASPNSASEYFVVEYRQKTGTFEISVPGTGLLVYRINTAAGNGNADGPPDEVYVYRPGGIDPYTNGTVNQAYYSATAGRTAIDDCTSPSAFLADGSPGGLYLDSVGAPGATIAFHYGGPTGDTFQISGNAGTPGAILSYTDCGAKFATADGSGDYSFTVRSGWSGTVTPSKFAYVFTPPSRTYSNVLEAHASENYAATYVPAPTIIRTYPEGSTACLRPQIGVRLGLSGWVRTASGAFDPSKVTLTLDGEDRTATATISQSASSPASHAKLLYTPSTNLQAGSHQVRFIYPSPAGEEVRTWSFNAAGTTCTTSAPQEASATTSMQAPAVIAAVSIPPPGATVGARVQLTHRRLLLRR
jgi:hypothetical protein